MRFFNSFICLGVVLSNLLTANVQAESNSSRHLDINTNVEIQQRFNQFQNATSYLKQVGHTTDTAVFDAALANFLSFIAPNYVSYQFDTVNEIFNFPTIGDISAAYTYYATVLYNGYSQHFNTNMVTSFVPHTHKKQVHMLAGGGEYGSVLLPAATEQTTLSSFDVIWIYLETGPAGANWYIYNYLETGNRIFRFCPNCGPYTLNFARTYPGGTPETGVASCADCP